MKPKPKSETKKKQNYNYHYMRWEWEERENPERREFYSNSKTKVSKNLFTTNYLINLNLNLKSGKNRPKKWQEQDKIIWKKFSTKLSESKNFFTNFFVFKFRPKSAK